MEKITQRSSLNPLTKKATYNKYHINLLWQALRAQQYLLKQTLPKHYTVFPFAA